MLKVDHIYKTFNPGTINEKNAFNCRLLCFSDSFLCFGPSPQRF